MNTPSLLRRLLTGALLGVSALHAGAQAWPTKPIMMVVPWPAGGPSDFVARKLQPDLAKALGQPVVVDNIGFKVYSCSFLWNNRYESNAV